MRTIFALANGRSGTHFLYQIIKRNVTNCVIRHEPYGYNPSMFGRPIYDHQTGDKQRVRRLVARKQRIVQRYAPRTYVETSHAFLKSYYDLAPEYFPSMQLVHLVRHPLKVAKSLANREELARRWRIPFCHYRGGDGRKYFRWALTRLEPIYTHFDLARLSLFQCSVLEWIEVENRAAWFLDHFNKRHECITVRVPEQINDPATIIRLLETLNLELRGTTIDLGGRTNRTPGIPTQIATEDRRQFDQILEQLPPQYLAPFKNEPYQSCEWVNLLVGT